jgi:hypothetical protein
MRLCFVIQPFDRGAFDARYDGTLKPAIRAAGFEPYRVDRDKTVSVPINSIESKVRSADACVADITEDNPNVWLELGFAIAASKPVLLLAKETKKRRKFPFDVQHRHIVQYRTDSERDFQLLRSEIIERLPVISARTTSPAVPTGRLSDLDETLREEESRFEQLQIAIASLREQENEIFSRLKLIFDIRANRAYENVNDPDLGPEIRALARKEAAHFASKHGLAAEWRQWLRLRSTRADRRRLSQRKSRQ